MPTGSDDVRSLGAERKSQRRDKTTRLTQNKHHKTANIMPMMPMPVPTASNTGLSRYYVAT
jgi:hypothetical protein